ncbi:MAG: hypothetical protein JST73_06185 [Actinobacteria bacterium]|nr:hypothetical protein [Actinomycetota bacterium]
MSSDDAFRFDDTARDAIAAALDDAVPGSVELGALRYVETLLGALDHDPPRIWAAPATALETWIDLGPWEHLAWERRIATWRDVYGRIATDSASDADRRVVFEHACEATYGDPAYGGNAHGDAWRSIGFAEPMFPPERTFTDRDVS